MCIVVSKTAMQNDVHIADLHGDMILKAPAIGAMALQGKASVCLWAQQLQHIGACAIVKWAEVPICIMSAASRNESIMLFSVLLHYLYSSSG